MCRYLMRPPLSQERLRIEPDGRVRVAFKSAWKDRAVVLHPLDFISRLCALVPPPRFHMVRYLGVLAPPGDARGSPTARHVGRGGAATG